MQKFEEDQPRSGTVKFFEKILKNAQVDEKTLEGFLDILEREPGQLDTFQNLWDNIKGSSNQNEIIKGYTKAFVETKGNIPTSLRQELPEIAEILDESGNRPADLAEWLYLEIIKRKTPEETLDDTRHVLGQDHVHEGQGVKIFNNLERSKELQAEQDHSLEQTYGVQYGDDAKKEDKKKALTKGEKVASNVRDVNEYRKKKEAAAKAKADRDQSSQRIPLEASQEEDEESEKEAA